MVLGCGPNLNYNTGKTQYTIKLFFDRHALFTEQFYLQNRVTQLSELWGCEGFSRLLQGKGSLSVVQKGVFVSFAFSSSLLPFSLLHLAYFHDVKELPSFI